MNSLKVRLKFNKFMLGRGTLTQNPRPVLSDTTDSATADGKIPIFYIL